MDQTLIFRRETAWYWRAGIIFVIIFATTTFSTLIKADATVTFVKLKTRGESKYKETAS